VNAAIRWEYPGVSYTLVSGVGFTFWDSDTLEPDIEDLYERWPEIAKAIQDKQQMDLQNLDIEI
jgi:flagellar biosynthesis/type III secretory pathway chaperone